jgi:hypothetical protein
MSGVGVDGSSTSTGSSGVMSGSDPSGGRRRRGLGLGIGATVAGPGTLGT